MFGRCLSALLMLVLLRYATSCRQSPPAPAAPATLRLSCENEPQTLDPRCARDLLTATVIHMLYEGLMRHAAGGQLEWAAAESVEVSADQLAYTFKLRANHWSNGDPVRATDFERTWKSALHPDFPCPNAYQLYAIRGARAAKEGAAPLDAVGVRALDERTLLVELEQPTPFFLSLVATHFYYPVHASWHEPKRPASVQDAVITNGPYQLERWSRHNELSAKRNPQYWGAAAIRLERIALLLLDNSTALRLFQNDEIDWTGSPLATLPSDALASLGQEGLLHVRPAAGVYFLRVNAERPPLITAKMRQALALALNRQALVEHVLQGHQVPALGIVPPSFLADRAPLFQDHDQAQARQLFQEALAEQRLTPSDLPPLSLAYAAGERPHKIAQVIQQQWKETLGLSVQLESIEPKVYYDRLKHQDYQLGIGSWFADFHDPIAFLEVFQFKNNGTNNTQWEHPSYIAQLEQSRRVQGTARLQLLKQAEETLMTEMPVIPLFYAAYNYVHKAHLKGVYFSELGYLDFKNAYWERLPGKQDDELPH